MVLGKREIFLFCILGIFFLFSLQRVSAQTIPEGVVSYYNLDELSGSVVIDSEGNFNGTNDGALQGVEGIILTAYQLNGSGAQIGLDDFDINTSQQFTINAWFKANETNEPDQGQWIIGQGRFGQAANSFGGVDLHQNRLRGFFYVSSTSFAVDIPFTDTENFTMVTIVSNLSTFALYINGELVNSTSIPGTIQDIAPVTTEWILGNQQGSSVNYFNGTIDEVSIFNTNLSAEQIEEYYASYLQNRVDLLSPEDNYQTASSPINFTISMLPVPGISGYSNVNATIFIWDDEGDLVNQSTVGVSGSSLNTTTIPISLDNIGEYTWNSQACFTNSTDVQCIFAENNRSFIYGFVENSITFDTPVLETSEQTLVLNVTLSENIILSSATLNYNNTSYASTKSTSGDNVIFSNTIDIPSVDSQENVSFYWILNLDGNLFNSTTNNQTVSAISFGLCNATLTNPYINFTFKDETDLSNINASISSAEVDYYLGGGSVTKSFIFSNSTENPSYSLCFSPPTRTLYADIDFQYASTNYPQRTYNPSTLTLTNSTTNQTLYLLGTDDGQYVTFQVINVARQPLADVFSNVTREINGEDVLVGSGVTDSSGGITYWLNPNFLHDFYFVLSPYPTFTTSLFPTQTSYTISLGSADESNVSNLNQGITYSVKPISDYLSNGTYYLFNFTLNSSFWSLDEFGFNITNQDGDLISSNSSTSSFGGVLQNNVSTGSNESFIMNYYWVVNGTTITASRSWLIIDLSGAGFSIANLVSRFSSYASLGFFGIDDFGIGLICFILILAVTGTIRVTHGISDVAVLVGIMFSLVALLDVSFSLIPNPVGAIPHFPTILMGVIFSGFLYKEVFN